MAYNIHKVVTKQYLGVEKTCACVLEGAFTQTPEKEWKINAKKVVSQSYITPLISYCLELVLCRYAAGSLYTIFSALVLGH